MTKNFCKKLKNCPFMTGSVRRVRFRNLNIRNCYRNKLRLTSAISEENPCITEKMTPDRGNMTSLEKLIKARELMLEVEGQFIKDKGYCPYELGYALKNLDQIINQISH